jgi:hypothetical protein
MPIIYIAAFAVIYAMGWTQGNLRGQIKAQREHLKFLRESSRRADELRIELLAMTAPALAESDKLRKGAP